MSSLTSDLRYLIATHGLPAVHAGLQAEMKSLYEFLRQTYEPPKNNLVIPVADVIPDRIATPHHKPLSTVVEMDPPDLELSATEEVDLDQETTPVEVPVEQKDPSLREIILKAKSESLAQPGEKFSKAKHKEEALKKYKELSDKGIKPESLLTKENLSKWLGEGMSYMRIAREVVGVHENEIAAVAKTFGLQSDIKKYIVMKKGSK
jgi:hypothetical protein